MKGFLIDAENARRSYLSEQYKRVKVLKDNIDMDMCRTATIKQYAEIGISLGSVPSECKYEMDEHRLLPNEVRHTFENEHPGYFVYQVSKGPWIIGLNLFKMK